MFRRKSTRILGALVGAVAASACAPIGGANICTSTPGVSGGAYESCQNDGECECGHCVEKVTDTAAGAAYGWGKCAPECAIDDDCVVRTPVDFPAGAVSVLDPGYECRQGVCRIPPITTRASINLANPPSEYAILYGSTCSGYIPGYSSATARFDRGPLLDTANSLLDMPVGTCREEPTARNPTSEVEQLFASGGVAITSGPDLTSQPELGFDTSSWTYSLIREGHWSTGDYVVRVNSRASNTVPDELVAQPFNVTVPVVSPISFDRSRHDGAAPVIRAGEVFRVAWGSAVYLSDLVCNPAVMDPCQSVDISQCDLSAEAESRLRGAAPAFAMVRIQSPAAPTAYECKSADDGLSGTFEIPAEITKQLAGKVSVTVSRLQITRPQTSGVERVVTRSGSLISSPDLFEVE